jgi:hypothetical protein
MDYDTQMPMASTMMGNPQGNRGFQFPFKLHEMLAVVKAEGKEAILSWQPHGRAFRVHNRELFIEVIMPRFFKQTKYKSYQRQLHLWGFKRIVQGEDGGAYFHPHFLRGQPSHCKYMCRQKIKGQLLEEDSKTQSLELPDSQRDIVSLVTAIQNAENATLLSMIQRPERTPVNYFYCPVLRQSSPLGLTTVFDYNKPPVLSLPPAGMFPNNRLVSDESAPGNLNLVSVPTEIAAPLYGLLLAHSLTESIKL